MTIDARRYREAVVLRDGSAACIRAIRADDRERLASAFRGLEPASVYLRYFSFKPELTDADLDRLTEPDFDDRVVLVVTVGDGAAEAIVGSGGYVAHREADGSRVAEVAFAVEEDYQGRGIAGRLLAVLARIGRDAGIDRFVAEVLAHNAPMLRVAARSHLPMRQRRTDDGVVRVTLSLAASTPAGASR